MAISNVETIKKLMHFEIEGDVYYIQVMQRGKDGHDRDHIIKDYHIHNFEHFDRELPNIIELANKYHARAMIRLNQRNTLDANIRTQIETLVIQLEVNRVMRKMIRTGDTKLKLPNVLSSAKLYSSALGQTCTEDAETRKWIVDIDPDMVDPNKEGFGSIEEIADTFEKYILEKCGNPKHGVQVYCRLPSKHGIHLVTSTFMLNTFLGHFGKPSKQANYVMCDANTNLYIPD